MEIKYFEIIFSDDDHEPECLADEAMCIKGYRRPSIEEANRFCRYDVENIFHMPVTGVYEIDEERARAWYDFSNESEWPIFN